MTPTIEETLRWAITCHAGQVDKAGLPYILHPLRVMSSFVLPEQNEERTVAVLHDIIEDTEVTLEILAERGYSAQIVAAIDAISRRKSESYAEYIDRLKNNPLAVRVKLADLKDNLDPARTSTRDLSPDALYRYRRAKALLEAAWAAHGFRL